MVDFLVHRQGASEIFPWFFPPSHSLVHSRWNFRYRIGEKIHQHSPPMATDPDKQPDPAPTSEPQSEAEKTQAFLLAAQFADVFQAARAEALEWNDAQTDNDDEEE